MNRPEFLQKLFREYEAEHNHAPSGTRAVAEWAVERGKLNLPVTDPYAALAQEISRALRGETATDKHGRKYRVNHAVRENKNGEQQTIWGQVGKQSRQFMEKSFTQRREQIVGDCYHLKVDVDAYNDAHPDEEAIQLELNFTDDVAEREVNLYSDDESEDEAA